MKKSDEIKKLLTARNILHRLENRGILENNLSMEQITTIRTAEYALDELCKSIDAQSVKRGRWIWDSNAPHREHGAYKCSNCGCHSDFEENYCYNCGARMEGETNG